MYAIRSYYAQFNIKGVTWLGNRGTSGIDGSVSTAVGYASCSSQINTLILGDLSFFYDSNGLWNKYLGENVRIILLRITSYNVCYTKLLRLLVPAVE